MALLFVPKCVLVVQKALKKQPTSLTIFPWWMAMVLTVRVHR